MIRVAALLALLALLAAPVAAQGGPEADVESVRVCHAGAAPYDIAPACIGAAANACQTLAGGSTTIGIVGCLASEAAAWDALRAADAAGGPQQASRADALRDAQRAWIAFRDADCALVSSIWQDGTIRRPAAAQCLLTLTARRTLELRNLRRNGEGTL